MHKANTGALRNKLHVYAPLFEKESTFHRTLFIFMCASMTLQDQHEQWKRHPEKSSRSSKIFHCQMPRSNPFYSSKPPRHDGTVKPSEVGVLPLPILPRKD